MRPICLGPAHRFPLHPYLTEVAEHLAHQYLVTFLIKPGDKAGFQAVRLTTEVPNAELVAASRVCVPAAARSK